MSPEGLPSTSPEVLRDLAGVLRARADAVEAADPRRRAVARLSPESLDELADMVLLGRRPTLGWWRRHLPKEDSHDE